jgi:hypothetical protein
MGLIETLNPKPKVPTPKCPGCGREITGPRWLDSEIPAKSGSVFRFLYCREDDCNILLGFTFVGQREPDIMPVGSLPAGFDLTKVRG